MQILWQTRVFGTMVKPSSVPDNHMFGIRIACCDLFKEQHRVSKGHCGQITELPTAINNLQCTVYVSPFELLLSRFHNARAFQSSAPALNGM